ncbi:MAG TPA: ribosome silencing factor [Fimbriimonadaceae bacterium]|nr:ribosome silencing factor [Fimbriimonadaceae bacterium]
MTSNEKAEQICAAADDMKAERIEMLDVHAKTSVADFFIVCSGNSDRHVDAIAERVAEKMAELKSRPLRTEGDRTGWVLQDYGDVIFHVMREEQRQFFDLETFWNTMKPSPDLA